MAKDNEPFSIFIPLMLLLLSASFAAVVLIFSERAPAENPPAPSIVIIGDNGYPADSTVLVLPGGDISPAELIRRLGEFPALERVELPDSSYSFPIQRMISVRYPDLTFVWPVTVCSARFSSDAETLSFAGREDLTVGSLAEILERARLFPALKTVDLTHCGLDRAAVAALQEAMEGVKIDWTFPLYGVEVSTCDREIALGGAYIQDGGAALEDAIGLMPELRRVDLCDAVVSDNTVLALRERHEDIRFVWLVRIKWAAIPTDSDFFIPYAESGVRQTGGMAGIGNLWYCPDLTALDLGHSGSADVSFLTVMPHMKYLILAEDVIFNFQEVGKLKELKWLEIFLCYVDDITPLAGCTALEDLNVCYLVTDGNALYETLRQMTWLKRLWCSGTYMTPGQVADLRRALPDCEIWCVMGDESTGGTWRFSESYYEMRDAFHMYYMDITGGITRRLSPEELQAVHDRYWN